MKKKRVFSIIGVIIVMIVTSLVAFALLGGINILASPDTDKDGFLDDKDAFPNNPNEWMDNDKDGIGDNTDKFPHDSTQSSDRDNDGFGDNPNGNNPDKYPDNPNEWKDSDEDGVGDNADKFPYDSTQSVDRDGDGFGDNPIGNDPDLFPDDENESKDSDSDAIGDNADIYDGGNGGIEVFISRFACDNPGDEGNTLPDPQFNLYLTAWNEFGYGLENEHYEKSTMVFTDTINISKNVFQWIVDVPDDYTKQISLQIYVHDVDYLDADDSIDTMEWEGVQDANVDFYPRQNASQTYIVDGRLDMGDDEFDGWMEFTISIVPY